MKNKVLFIIILLIYFLLPIVILLLPVLFKYKFVILTITGIVLLVLFKLLKINYKDLGITKNNLGSSIKNNLILMTFGVFTIIILLVMGLNKYVPNESILFYPFYILISVPIQEFLYRGIFGYFDLYLIKNRLITTVLSSLCYSFVHIIYQDVLTCLLTFIIGIIWYILYSKDRNLMGVILSHIVLGILIIVLGIVN